MTQKTGTDVVFHFFDFLRFQRWAKKQVKRKKQADALQSALELSEEVRESLRIEHENQLNKAREDLDKLLMKTEEAEVKRNYDLQLEQPKSRRYIIAPYYGQLSLIDTKKNLATPMTKDLVELLNKTNFYSLEKGEQKNIIEYILLEQAKKSAVTMGI